MNSTREPQGSVITMLCFLILPVVNKVRKGVEGGERDIRLFMDDLAFVQYRDNAVEVVK